MPHYFKNSKKSDRKGISEIIEHQIWSKRISGYRIEGGIVGRDEGHGSGFGDLWSWTYFCSKDKNSLEIERGKEAIRIKEKYPSIA